MQNPEFVKKTFEAIASRYVATNHVLSLGIDMLWRQRVVQLVSEWKPGTLLDLATGTGDLALALQRALPDTDITGSDFCQAMLDIADQRGVRRTICADAMDLPFAASAFDAVTVAFGLRNMASWPGALAEMRRVIQPGGHVLILDFSLPEAKMLRNLYRVYLHHALPRIAGIMTGHPEAYDYLADSIETFPRGQGMLDLLAEAGFEDNHAEALNGGIATIYYGERS